MGDALPKGWSSLKLSDVADEISERIDNPSKSGYDRFVGLEHLDSGELTVRRWGRTTDLISAMKLFKSGDILIGRRNAYLRRASKVEFDGVCSGDAYVVREKPGTIAERLLPIILNTDAFWDYTVAHASGTMSKRAKWRDLSEYSFTLPSLPEQRRIASLLWAAEDSIIKGEGFLAAAERAKQVLMGVLFSNGIEHKEFQETTFGKIPRIWNILKLYQVSEIVQGAALGRKLKGKTIIIPYLRVANVQDGFIDTKEIKEMEILDGEKNKWILKKGDILLTEGGDWDQLGRGGIWDGTITKCIHQNHIFRVRLNDPNIETHFLHYLINSQFGKLYFLKCSKQTTNLASINQTQLKNFPVVIPPLPEQRKIASILTRCDETISAARANVAATKALKIKMINEMLNPKANI
jgi:type I restriction enzyme S subunit